jgi:hypothetical protein
MSVFIGIIPAEPKKRISWREKGSATCVRGLKGREISNIR